MQPLLNFFTGIRQLFRVKLESVLVLTPSVLKLSSGDNERESLFRCETKVFERSASGYGIAPSHSIFTVKKLLRAASRFL
jgi:hypothetical protein